MSATFNKAQVQNIPEGLGLDFRWERRENVDWVIVEETIEYNGKSFWTRDLRNNVAYHSTQKFNKLCQELANSKRGDV